MRRIAPVLLAFTILALPAAAIAQDRPPRPERGPGGGPGDKPMGGPYTHVVLSASSEDGLTWKRDPGVRIEHASVPCAVAAPDGRVFLYYVDADRGPGQCETVNVAVSTDGVTFEPQGLVIDGLPGQKAVDPCVLLEDDGTFTLYYFSCSIPGDPLAEEGAHEIHRATSKDGVRFIEQGACFSEENLVDPDVFRWQSRWFMYVFGRGRTVIATSTDGKSFARKGDLHLQGWGTVKPLEVDGKLRLYAFDQRKPTENEVHSFVSTDGIQWKEEPGVRLKGEPGEQITDPFVIRWKDGYKMYFKKEVRTGRRR